MLSKIKKDFLKKKRELIKKVMKRDSEDSSLQRIYGERTKTTRALKVEMFGSKSKKSSTEGDETSIEKFVREFLVSRNLSFKEQKALRYLNYDFFLKDYRLFIEVNGDYFHVNKKVYPNGPKNDLQKRNLLKNEQKRKFCEEKKFNLLEIWELDIIQKPEKVKEYILFTLSEIEKDNIETFRLFTTDNC